MGQTRTGLGRLGARGSDTRVPRTDGRNDPAIASRSTPYGGGYSMSVPLLALLDNLHSRCAAISDYPSRPSSPADRWLYLLIGPLNLLGWRAPRAASGAPEAHRHTTPASALKQAPHWEPHTHAPTPSGQDTPCPHIQSENTRVQGKRRVGHARLRTTRTMGLSKQPEAASRRRRVLSALQRFGWIARFVMLAVPLSSR